MFKMKFNLKLIFSMPIWSSIQVVLENLKDFIPNNKILEKI